MPDRVLSFFPESQGIDKGVIDLACLYHAPRDRDRFEQKWPSFVASDPLLSQVVSRTGGDQLHFLTESLVPTTNDARPPFLLLLGNPAPHSVLNGLPFSFEGNQREHRFWIALRDAGLVAFNIEPSKAGDWRQRNQQRKDALYTLRYDSPFRLGIAVYFSMPSPASVLDWAGVEGLRRLFGRPALRTLAIAEDARIAQVIHTFNGGAGAVIAFQRDAYEGSRSPTDRYYDVETARHDLLEGICKFDPRVRLFGSPPTRRIRTELGRAALARIKARITEMA